MVPRENKSNAFAKFWRALNKEYCGIFKRKKVDVKIIKNKSLFKLLFLFKVFSVLFDWD